MVVVTAKGLWWCQSKQPFRCFRASVRWAPDNGGADAIVPTDTLWRHSSFRAAVRTQWVGDESLATGVNGTHDASCRLSFREEVSSGLCTAATFSEVEVARPDVYRRKLSAHFRH